MKRKYFFNHKIILAVALIAFITVGYIALSRQAKHAGVDFETLQLEEIHHVELSDASHEVSIYDTSKLERIVSIVKEKMQETSYVSVSDVPTKFEGQLLRIELNKKPELPEQNTIFYAYKKGNAYYIEAPYYAIWTVDSDAYAYFLALLTNA